MRNPETTTDLSKVVRRPADGILFPSGFQIGICDDQSCSLVHVHLFDSEGRIFAAMLLNPEQTESALASIIGAQKLAKQRAVFNAAAMPQGAKPS